MQFGGGGRVQVAAGSGGHRRLRRLLSLLEPLGIGIKRLCGTAFAGQAQGFGAKGRIIDAPLGRFGRSSHQGRKVRPSSILLYPTTSPLSNRS